MPGFTLPTSCAFFGTTNTTHTHFSFGFEQVNRVRSNFVINILKIIVGKKGKEMIKYHMNLQS